MRSTQVPCRLETVSCRSYDGKLQIEETKSLDIEGRHILFVGDIYDSGRTFTT